MLIDKSYFTGEIVIPNLESCGAGISQSISNANSELLNKFIMKYEYLFLTKLLGGTLCGEFMRGVGAEDVEDRWIALKNMIVHDTAKVSPIANYVYYWYLRNEETKTTGIGEVVGQANNAVVIGSCTKLSRAWNEMVDYLTGIISFVDTNRSVYQNFCPDYKADIFFKINSFNL